MAKKVKKARKGRTISVFVAKKRDEEIVRALAKFLNEGTRGQRAARTKRKKAVTAK